MNSVCGQDHVCECCGEPNMGGLIDPKLSHCCIHCVEEGAAEIAEGDEVYRRILTCTCGLSGPVNYDDGQRIGYYCGGSERCIP